MNKKISLGTVIALIAVAVALSVTLTMAFAMRQFSVTVSDVNQRQALLDYLTEVDKKVREQYDGDIDEALLRESVAASYVDGIGDPYAEYLTADEYAEVQAELLGEAEGFGLTVLHSGKGQLTVDSVESGSPAATAGLKVGAQIVKVNDLPIGTEMTITNVQDLLKTAGKIQLTVQQDDKERSFSLVSSAYILETVTGKMIKKTTIGYVKVSAFADNTPQQFATVVESLKTEGATAFVFDLRNNAGGSLAAAREMLGYLLPRGAYGTLTKSGMVEQLVSEGTTELTQPSATLINGATAGEAELFAGVMAEQQKTTLVGTTSNGCAMVQEYFPITSTNARIKLSTGQLALTVGGSWQDVGLTPSREVLAISMDGNEDAQLQAAIDLLTTNAATNNGGM
ncbi:MAG: PDZ domain-containing protein [Clostridia bacterium]|nr:PDZ domain-containing protein [Clostridia bacterium]